VTGADAPGRGRRPRSTYAPIDAAGGEDAASRAKRDALARQRGPGGAYWRSASDLDAGAQPSWWDWRGLSETEQSQWIATAIMIIVSAAAGWFVLNGGMARFAVKASAVTFAPLARGARAGFASAVTSAADLMQLLLDSVAVAWSLLVAPFVGFGQSVSRFGVSSADRASSLLSAFNPRVYDVPAMPYGARPGPQGAAAAAGYGGYGPAAGMQRGAAFAPLLPSPGSMYAAPARGFRPGARPPVQLPGARNAQRFAPGARAPARMRTPEQEEQDRRAELFHSGRCGSNNPDVELCDSIKQRRWSAPRDRAGRPINADVPVRPLGPQYAQTHTALAAQTAHAGFYAAQQQQRQQGFAGGAGSQAPFEFGRPAQCPPKRGPAQCPPKRGPAPPPPPPQCAGPPPSCLAEAQVAALSQAEALAAESAAAAAAEAAQLGADGECDVWLAAGDAAEAAAAQEAPPAPEGDHLPICGAEHDALPICSAADMAAAAPAPAASKAETKQAAAPAAAAPVAAPKAASLRVPRSGGDLSAMQRSRAAAFAAAKCGSADADAAACKALLDTALEVMVPGGATADAASAPATPAAAPATRASLWKRLLDGAKSAKPAAAAAVPAPAPVVGEAAAPAEPAAVVEAGAPAAAEAPAAAPALAGLSPVARRRVAVAQAAASCASARGASDAAAAALRASQTHLAARLDAAAEAHAACRAMLPTNGSKPSRATAERHDACLRQSDKLAADAEAASDDFEAAARDAERLATVMVEICGAVAAAA